MIILKTEGVCKKYLKKQALNGINMCVESGKIVGILGPNGSGKTTFIKLLAGMLRPTAGSIKICNIGIGYKTKNFVAYLPNTDYLYQWMKIEDAKKVYSSFFIDFDLKKFNELITFMKLEGNMNVKSLSKGMKEKLALSLTLARNAKLTMLDEPLSGVDPVEREHILGAILKGFSYDGSIIVTSHLINEIERIIDEVYFLKNGIIELSGNVEDLRTERAMTLDELYREVFSC